jgi:hypothetical protein
MVPKTKSIPISIQAFNIKKLFPETKVETSHDQYLSWTHTIIPSPLGDYYKIKIVYHMNLSPKIFVINPKPLALAKGKDRLPHCYDQKLQRLCLYYPDGYEWNKSMLISTTIIPWAYEWLYHYEIWLGTGEWHGGGIHISTDGEKQAKEQKQLNTEVSDNK